MPPSSPDGLFQPHQLSLRLRRLRKLRFQVADKDTARVLVELHNKDYFRSALVVVGRLSFMSWLNELGAHAVASRTQDLFQPGARHGQGKGAERPAPGRHPGGRAAGA